MVGANKPLARVVTPDEYERIWKPIREKTFDYLIGNVDLPDFSPFRHEEWIRIALPYDIWNGEFALPVGAPFPTGTSRTEFVDDLPSVFSTAVEFGCREILISAEPIQAEIYNAVRPSVSAISAIWEIRGNSAGGFPVMVFDNTGLWGMVTYWERNGVLAGIPEFIDRYLDKIGGLDFAKARFYAFDIDNGESLYGNRKEKILAFYAMIGWDPPRYPDGDPRAS